ncbi:MAG: hypothetical protein QXO04_02520 [Nitrososphaerota archaeon]
MAEDERIKVAQEWAAAWIEREEGGFEAELRQLEGLAPEVWAEIRKPLGINDLADILETTIKKDRVNKIIHFLAAVLTYSDDSQVTVSNRGPSSTGKSYLPLEISSLYFPPSDVITLAYASPTSFFHDAGMWDPLEKCYRVNLERKILVFVDQPHDELLRRLRPLLSHDQKELTLKITDRREKKGLRTKTVKIRGFPTVFFCTGSLKIDEQEATRSFILSPEMSQEKIREAIYLKALRKGNPEEFKTLILSNPEIEFLRLRVLAIKHSGVERIVVKNPEEVASRFMSEMRGLRPRHVRDVERIISLAQGLALLNFWHRDREDSTIFVSEEDIEQAFTLYSEIAQAQELGLAPYLLALYQQVFEPLSGDQGEGLRREDILKRFYHIYGRVLPVFTLEREILPALEAAGLIRKEPDPNDRRRTLIRVETFEKYIAQQCGVTPPSSKEAQNMEIQPHNEYTGKSERQGTLPTPSKDSESTPHSRAIYLSPRKACRECFTVLKQQNRVRMSAAEPGGLCEYCGKEANSRFKVWEAEPHEP